MSRGRIPIGNQYGIETGNAWGNPIFDPDRVREIVVIKGDLHSAPRPEYMLISTFGTHPLLNKTLQNTESSHFAFLLVSWSITSRSYSSFIKGDEIKKSAVARLQAMAKSRGGTIFKGS